MKFSVFKTSEKLVVPKISLMLLEMNRDGFCKMQPIWGAKIFRNCAPMESRARGKPTVAEIELPPRGRLPFQKNQRKFWYPESGSLTNPYQDSIFRKQRKFWTPNRGGFCFATQGASKLAGTKIVRNFAPNFPFQIQDLKVF